MQFLFQFLFIGFFNDFKLSRLLKDVLIFKLTCVALKTQINDIKPRIYSTPLVLSFSNFVLCLMIINWFIRLRLKLIMYSIVLGSKKWSYIKFDLRSYLVHGNWGWELVKVLFGTRFLSWTWEYIILKHLIDKLYFMPSQNGRWSLFPSFIYILFWLYNPHVIYHW